MSLVVGLLLLCLGRMSPVSLFDSRPVPSLGFWLVNHSRVKGSEYARPNENALLVIVDLTNKQIGFSLGYFAEYLLGEEDAHRTLQAARPYLVNGDYGRALITLYKKLGRVLSRRARVLKKNQRQGRKPDYEIQNVPNILDVPNLSSTEDDFRRQLDFGGISRSLPKS